MYPYSRLARPVSTRTFYVLLALARSELHVYALKGAILNDSLGSVDVSVGQLYPLVVRLQNEGLIDPVGVRPAGKSGRERWHYGLSTHGERQLKAEFARLDHLMRIREAAGL